MHTLVSEKKQAIKEALKPQALHLLSLRIIRVSWTKWLPLTRAPAREQEGRRRKPLRLGRRHTPRHQAQPQGNEKEKVPLQIELLKLQLFTAPMAEDPHHLEGQTVGGGSISAFTEHLNPCVALGCVAVTGEADRYRADQRYSALLSSTCPRRRNRSDGFFAANRAGVESGSMGYCTQA